MLFTYEIGGKIFAPIFYYMYCWPLALIQQYDAELHSQLLGVSEGYSNAFVKGLYVTFIGWMALSPFFAAIIWLKGYWSMKSKTKSSNLQPVAGGDATR